MTHCCEHSAIPSAISLQSSVVHSLLNEQESFTGDDVVEVEPPYQLEYTTGNGWLSSSPLNL